MTPRIAIVDDDESVRCALGRLVRSVGMETSLFPSGKEFLRSLSDQPHSCVVLDIHMPQLDGLEVQRRLLESKPEIPVIMITAHDLLGTRRQAMEAGAAAYLIKPVNDVALLEAIEGALGKAGSGA